MPNSSLTLSNGLALELRLGAHEQFLGFGAVTLQGVALRDGRRPWNLRLDTPEGILYTVLTLRDVSPRDGGYALMLEAVGLPWGRGEYCDEYDQSLVWPELPVEPVRDTVIIDVQPAAHALGGRDWQGFTYTVTFRSEARQIHRLLTHATWEIGGAITGNTVLHQGQCNMPVYHGSAEAVFTTTCLKTLDQFGSPQGISYQMAPRGGLLQAFDFQYADAGALLMYWPRFASISSLVESAAGSDVLHVIDEYRFTQATEVTTPAKQILFTPGPLEAHEARNLWWAAHEHVYGGIRDAFGVAPSLVKPEVGLRYATRVTDTGLKMSVAGVEVDSAEVPYAIADYVLPRIAERGIRRFFPEVMSESDVTVLGLRRKLDDGVHGDLHCSSVCATHRFLPSAFWGGLPAWRYMADKAHALGIELGAWFAPHFSPRSAIFQEHPEYRLISANTLPNGGGYGVSTIVVGDWHSGLYQWVLDDIRRWKEEAGLDYIFTDSWANLGLVQMNFANAMATNLEPLGRLYADFQRLGINVFSFEGISPFGVSRFGLADLRGDLLEAQGGVVGQNDFGWWVGEEDMAYGLCLCAHARKRAPEELARIQFRLMANRSFGMFETQYTSMYDMPDWWVRLNHLYLQALPHMQQRTLLPNGQGVQWTDGATEILWMYADADVTLAAGAMLESLTDGAVQRGNGGPVPVQAQHVYRLTREHV